MSISSPHTVANPDLVPPPWQSPFGTVEFRLPDGTPIKVDVKLTEAWLWFFQTDHQFATTGQYEIDVAATLALEAASKSKARQQMVSDASGASALKLLARRLAAVEGLLFGPLARQPRQQKQEGPASDVAALAIALASRRQPPLAPQVVYCTQATFPTLGDLPVPSLIAVTDYEHMIFWDGTTSTFMDGGNGFIALFEDDPSTEAWALCDGTPVDVLNADGTTRTLTPPDLVSSGAVAAYLKAGSPNSGPNAAVAPTISGHTEDAAVGISGSTDVDSGPGTVVQSGAGTTVATHTHTHASTGLSGDNHNHNLASADAPISDTGEPRNIVRRPWIRR